MTRNKKLAIIGGTPIEDRASSFGGTTVLLQNMIDYCTRESIPHMHILTNKYGGALASIRNMGFLFSTLFSCRKEIGTLMVNISSYFGGVFVIYPLVLLYAKIFGKKIVFRKFGGVFHQKLDESPFLRSVALWLLRKTDLTMVETQSMLKYFEEKGIRTFWFPNVRTASEERTSPTSYTKRFVFISHVRPSKGVDIILNVSKQLPEDYVVDIYGPIMDEKYTPSYFAQYKAQYKGVLNPDEVRSTLASYDVLLLPTYWPGEGYPGIMIEAFSVGVPAIASSWGGIPEIVQNGKNGIIIPVKDEEALREAMLSIDTAKYQELSHHALHSFLDYDDNIVNERVLSAIHSL